MTEQSSSSVERLPAPFHQRVLAAAITVVLVAGAVAATTVSDEKRGVPGTRTVRESALVSPSSTSTAPPTAPPTSAPPLAAPPSTEPTAVTPETSVLPAPPTTRVVTTTTTAAPSRSPAPTPAPAPPAPPTPPVKTAPRHASIVNYLEGGSVGELVVPNGRYAGGSVAAPRSGWLVLRAESPGGVVVDLSRTGFRLDRGTNNVVFVGFRFVNGEVRLTGVRDVHFWYCAFTFPAAEWHRQYQASGGPASAPRSERSRYITKMANPLPTGLRVDPAAGDAPESIKVGVYGSDFHELGDDGVFIGHTRGARLEGLRIWQIEEGRYDPGRSFGNDADWFHNDGIQAVAPTSDVLIADSWIGQKIQWGANGGTIADARFRRLWIAGSNTFGQIAGVANGGRILRSSQDGIRAFANGQRPYRPAWDRFRTDFVGDVQKAVWPQQYRRRGVFELDASNVDVSVPAGVAMRDGTLVDIRQVRDHPANPANRWRAAHRYESWATHLGIRR